MPFHWDYYIPKLLVQRLSMIEQLTSPSNESLNSNVLRLNGSSGFVSPSQSGFGSDLKANIVQFEQFQESTNPEQRSSITHNNMGKKKLTILIDESYEFQGEGTAQEKRAFQKSGTQYGESVGTPMNDFQLISPIESKNPSKYISLLKDMQEVENTNHVLMQRVDEADRIIWGKDEIIAKLKSEVEELRLVVRSKEQGMAMQMEQHQELHGKIEEKEQHLLQMDERLKQKDERMKEKDLKIREMTKMNVKLKNLSRDLLREVKEYETKVKELEKEQQKSICLATQENINKLKESSLKLKDSLKQTSKTSLSHNHHNKQNSFANTGVRKSLEKKKTGGSLNQLPQSKKTHRTNSSNSTTILNKKLMHK